MLNLGGRAMITGKTRLLALFGSPVSHSGSPKLYNSAFRKLGLDYVYVAIDIDKNVKDAISSARLFNLKGFNLTMPCKTEALKYIDEVSEEAEIIGSVNTVVNEDGRLKGYMTDGIGFVNNLTANGITIKNKKCIILGAGGAATAIALQLALEGALEVNVINRKGKTFDIFSGKLEKIRAFSGASVNIKDAIAIKLIKDADILVNATPIGMGTDETPVNSSLFHRNLVVADIVYKPLETTLLREAKESGCICINGIGMLQYQAVEAFKLFTGRDMPIEILKNF